MANRSATPTNSILRLIANLRPDPVGSLLLYFPPLNNSMKTVLRYFSFSPTGFLSILVVGFTILMISGCLPERPVPENEPSKTQAELAPAITPIPRQHLIASIGGGRLIFPPTIVNEWIESEPAFADKKNGPFILRINDAFPDSKFFKGWLDTRAGMVTVGMVTFCPEPDKKLVFSSFSRGGGRWIGVGSNNHSSIKLPPNSSIVVFATDEVLDAVIDLPGEVAYLVHAERGSFTVSVVEITGGI